MEKQNSKKKKWRLEDQAWWQKYSAQIKAGEIEVCRPGQATPVVNEPAATTPAAANAPSDISENTPAAVCDDTPAFSENAPVSIPANVPLLAGYDYTHISKNYILPDGRIVVPIVEAIQAGIINSSMNGSGILGSGIGSGLTFRITSGYIIIGSGSSGMRTSGLSASGLLNGSGAHGCGQNAANGFSILAYGLNLI